MEDRQQKTENEGFVLTAVLYAQMISYLPEAKNTYPWQPLGGRWMVLSTRCLIKQ